MNFVSDNTAGVAEEMLEALKAANQGAAASYGDDAWTRRLESELARVFEHSVWVFPVLTGTAANSLALSALVPPHGAILCHAGAHIVTDECGAPEFFSRGAHLATIEDRNGKLAPASIAHALARIEKGSVHHSQPAAISITQANEFGTSYRAEEIDAISAQAKRDGLKVHMDGARLANAVAYLGCTPADITWRAGVDVLSFGVTKLGALGAEAVVFFNEEDALDFGYRRKQAGHLVSKMRFVSAQLLCALENDRWISWASHANAMARRLAERLGDLDDLEIANPIEANLVFGWMTDRLFDRLQERGAGFLEWPGGNNARRLTRFVTSFATREEDIDGLVAAASA